TTNAGASWQNISANLPNVPVNCVIYDAPTNYLLIGTDIGVYYSDADQINWAPFGEGIPNVYVFDLKIRQASRRLYAGTHGRGIYSIPMESVTGTKNPVENTLQIQISPNPASNTIGFTGAGDHVFSGKVVLTDLSGRLMFQQNIQDQEMSRIVLKINQLPSGVYALRLVSGQDHFAPLKVVVQH
ncbi:MAG: T9SS type A sorting domain-containing protein, partial [Bacteroidota bacterium]